MGRLKKDEKSFIEGELRDMGAGDPNSKPGTWRSQDGKQPVGNAMDRL